MPLHPVLTCLLLIGTALPAAHAAAPTCPDFPALTDIMPGYEQMYSDGALSVIDPARRDHLLALMKPIHQAHSDLLRLAENAMADADEARARCAIDVLADWAARGVHTRLDTTQPTHTAIQQSAFEMKWMLISKALAYAYVKRYATPDEQQRIDAWLTRIAEEVIRDTSPGAPFHNTRQNNHQYWIGAALMATGIATGQGRYIKKARRMYESGVDSIQSDGLLPEEVKRAQQALHYHGYAASPLVLMAELSHKIGEDWYTYHDSRIKRLLAATLHGMSDPAWFSQQIGITQVTNSDTATEKQWIFFARHRFGADYPDWHAQPKPFYNMDYCGDIPKLIDTGYFEEPIVITRKGGWFD